MVKFVIKNDGTKVPFDMEKMRNSIMAACQDASIEGDEKNDIVEEVSSAMNMALESKEEVASAEIKSMILSELESLAPAAAEAWRKYDASKAG